GKLVRAASAECAALLGVESGFVRALAKDKRGTRHAAKRAKVVGAFGKAWNKGARNCPTTATLTTAEAAARAVADDLVKNTVVSPNVDDTQFTTITPTGPIQYQGKALNPVCMNGTPYAYFVKRGTVNNLLIYYQGGGACWE